MSVADGCIDGMCVRPQRSYDAGIECAAREIGSDTCVTSPFPLG